MYKLTYFNLKARAEPIRLIFALKEIPYEDLRVERVKEWPQLKPSFTWDQIPALEIKGKGVLLQSYAIARYLARKYDLTGADDYEAAKCDEYINALDDLRAEWRKFFFEQDEAKKSELKALLLGTHYPRYFAKFEKIKVQNGGDFLVGNQLTWADLIMAQNLEFYRDTVGEDVAQGYPALSKLKETVYAIPQIKKWIAERPTSPF